MGKYITEQANVMGIVTQFGSDGIEGETVYLKDIEKPFHLFKDEVTCRLNDESQPEVFFLGNGRCYSYEYLEKAIKTAEAYLGISKPTFYINEQDDFPCLICFHTLVFILAPRVETNPIKKDYVNLDKHVSEVEA